MDWPKITKDTPMEELKRIHQTIWDYAIEHGKKPETPYFLDCVACEWCKLCFGNPHGQKCSHCPIIWPGNSDHPCCVSPQDDGLYDLFCHSSRSYLRSGRDERKVFAKLIRDLPWKFEIEGNTTL